MNANRIRRVAAVILGMLTCAVLAQTVAARVVEGFESGDPAVTGGGDASVQTTFQGEVAPQGSNQYLITTINGNNDADGLTAVSGTNALANSSLQSFFFNDFSLTGQRGSGVLIPFSVVSGDTTLSFQYDFLSNEPAQTAPFPNDFGLEAIFNSSNSLVQSNLSFVKVSTSTFSLFSTGNQSPFIYHTGYTTFTINISGLAPGSYELGVGVENRGDGTHDSALLLDNFQINAVPEPATIGFSIAGAALLMALRSRIKRTS